MARIYDRVMREDIAYLRSLPGDSGAAQRALWDHWEAELEHEQARQVTSCKPSRRRRR